MLQPMEVMDLQLVHQPQQTVRTQESMNDTDCMAHNLCDLVNYHFHSLTDVEDIYLPLIPVGNISDTGYVQLPESDDDSSDAVNTPSFPFGDSIQTAIFVRRLLVRVIDSNTPHFFNCR